ncbi:MAG: GNAT family N-acetyltransferase [Nitrospiraceae bacterium]|nr:GNAT family N-acetyltransferase [Nitrospiraceae bacterium]
MPHSRGTVKKTCFGEIVIRRAGISDVPEMCGLLKELFSMESDFEPEPEKQGKGLGALINARNSALVLVAEKGGRVLGMCSVQILISTAEGGRVGLLEDLVVRSGARGAGIGSALLSEALKWCAFKGLLRVQLLRDESNSAALGFYTNRGWSGTHLVCMRKGLRYRRAFQMLKWK